jgi:hypothetical protein
MLKAGLIVVHHQESSNVQIGPPITTYFFCHAVFALFPSEHKKHFKACYSTTGQFESGAAIFKGL